MIILNIFLVPLNITQSLCDTNVLFDQDGGIDQMEQVAMLNVTGKLHDFTFLSNEDLI